MRPDQDADVRQAGIGAAANRLDPPLGERRLERRAPEERRADVQHEWPIRPQTHPLAERLIPDGGDAVEPLVVALGAGHHDAIGGHAVQLDGFPALRLVPENDAVGKFPQQ
jgi:hypothetical protein